MPTLSIIVPHFGSTGPLEDTLASVLQNRPEDSEILLVHPGSYDDPYDLAGEVRFVKVEADVSLADGLNIALQAAAGEYVHVIRPGIEVEESWCDAAVSRFKVPEVAAVCPLILRRETPNVIAAAGVRLSRFGRRRTVGTGTKHRFSKIARMKPLGPSLSAAFYRRDALERIGWLASDIGSDSVDVDAALSLIQAGYLCCFEPESTLWLVEHVEGDHRACFASARGSERMIWRHAPILGGHRTIASRLFLVSASLAFGVVRPKLFQQSLGRISAWFEFARHRRRWRELDAICDEILQSKGQIPAIKRLPAANQENHATNEDAPKSTKHRLKRAS